MRVVSVCTTGTDRVGLTELEPAGCVPVGVRSGVRDALRPGRPAEPSDPDTPRFSRGGRALVWRGCSLAAVRGLSLGGTRGSSVIDSRSAATRDLSLPPPFSD